MKITIMSSVPNTPKFNCQSMNLRIFLQKHNSVKINKKINHVEGNLDLSGSGDTIRGHELS